MSTLRNPLRVRSWFGAVLAGVVLTVAGLNFNVNHAVTPKEPWKTGYWIWQGDEPVAAGFKVGVLYVEAGRRWPHHLPDADEYVAVRRIEAGEELTARGAAALAEDFKALIADAGQQTHISGLQIDYDCPTGKLKSYAGFLDYVRQDLPANAHLSITALLDWFRRDTEVASVLEHVDEFVPQFYDAASVRSSAGIAEPISAEKWASRLNAFHVPYRIGISSFGRVARRRHSESQFFRDAIPLDFAGRREFARSVRNTAAGELVVHYDVQAAVPDKLELVPGDAVEITFPTEASVRAAYEAVKQFGGYCAGSIFFRWPNRWETLTLAPDDVQRIVSGGSLSAETTLRVRPAQCIQRHCSDLYLDLARSMRSAEQTIGVSVSGPMEVFIPAGHLQPRFANGGIDFTIPAYSGSGQVYLGRAISRSPLRFETRTP